MRPLRVLVDATALPEQRTGVGHYVLELVAALARRPQEVELHVLAKPRDAAELAARGAVVHTAALRSRPSRLVWEQTVLPVRVRRLAPDVLHGPHYTLPRLLPCPGVVTFHDPTFFTHPQVHERSKVAYFTRAARLGVRRAAQVIAISRYAAEGAVVHAGADPAKVRVVYHGVDLCRYRPGGDEAADRRLRARLGVREPYLLWVGAIEPRKDVPTLIEAFAGLEGVAALVLAGPRAWGGAAVDEAVDRHGVADRVLRPGYVSEEEKVALYRGAAALVYPSLAEGFGLQVLEAMACGCPVVTTSGSGPEEVCGDAAVLVPPGDPVALRRALASLLSQPARAAALRERGLRRAQAFSWERAAEGTIEAYRAAAACGEATA